jgi:hypothetical protein
LATVVAGSGCITGCVSEPEPGEYGTFRYVGNVRGATPLTLIPPVHDRQGNAYVLFGDISTLEVQSFVGSRAGGWSGGCDLSQGNDFGVHGFMGVAEDRVWYWAGEALVVVRKGGGCERVLEFDPSSGARLNVRAAVPWVRDTPSGKRQALAWIQSATDPLPFQVVLDLNDASGFNDGVYTEIREFDPGNASDVQVLGTGGRLKAQEGVVIARFTVDGTVRTEARFISIEGRTTDEVTLAGLDTLPQYGFLGYLQGNESGLYAGLDVEGQLVVFDRSGGKRVAVSGMTPAGVHEWDGQLYLVGEDGGRPKVAPIDDDGDIGDVDDWDASIAAIESLGGEIDVIDDRSLPSREIKFGNPRTAMGNFPFVQSHRLDYYADGTTAWLVAGPSFSAAGEDRTAIAYAPVGVSYP